MHPSACSVILAIFVTNIIWLSNMDVMQEGKCCCSMCRNLTQRVLSMLDKMLENSRISWTHMHLPAYSALTNQRVAFSFHERQDKQASESSLPPTSTCKSTFEPQERALILDGVSFGAYIVAV